MKISKKILMIFILTLMVNSKVYSQSLNEKFVNLPIKNQTSNTKNKTKDENGLRSFNKKGELIEVVSADTDEYRTNYLNQNSFRVHVLGEVQNPGMVSIQPSSRLLDALAQAGGILNNGSQRLIEIRRNGKKSYYDLFNYKLYAELKQNPFVSENDVIYVPLKKGEIRVEGPIKRPGLYELINENKSLESIINLIGGFTEGFDKNKDIKLVRYNEEGKKEIFSLNVSDEKDMKFKILYGDILVFPHVLLSDTKFDYNIKNIPGDNIFYPTLTDQVYVTGAVLNPGPFEYQPSYSYQDYINLAGPNQDSSVSRSKIIMVDGKKKLAKRTKQINPGDTIIVPSKSFTVKNTLSLIGSVTSTTLTSILLYDRIKD